MMCLTASHKVWVTQILSVVKNQLTEERRNQEVTAKLYTGKLALVVYIDNICKLYRLLKKKKSDFYKRRIFIWNNISHEQLYFWGYTTNQTEFFGQISQLKKNQLPLPVKGGNNYSTKPRSNKKGDKFNVTNLVETVQFQIVSFALICYLI